MKKVTIHDANILIDISNLSLTEVFFKLDFEFHTTDLAFNEVVKGLKIKDRNIFKNKLKIKSFESRELLEIVKIGKKHKSLSIQDLSVLKLAISLNGILCTTDKNLKEIASGKNLEIHGTLWIVEQMIISKKLNSKIAIKKLKKLKDTNPRAPKKEIKNLIERIRNFVFLF